MQNFSVIEILVDLITNKSQQQHEELNNSLWAISIKFRPIIINIIYHNISGEIHCRIFQLILNKSQQQHEKLNNSLWAILIKSRPLLIIAKLCRYYYPWIQERATASELTKRARNSVSVTRETRIASFHFHFIVAMLSKRSVLHPPPVEQKDFSVKRSGEDRSISTQLRNLITPRDFTVLTPASTCSLTYDWNKLAYLVLFLWF